jgi:hypothetical protein
MNCEELIEAWDKDEIITSIEMGGLGPGYEQAIQTVAVEFARATKDVDPGDRGAFQRACHRVLETLDNDLRGITLGMFAAAEWLARKWRTVGPEGLIEEAKKDGKEDRIVLVRRVFP